MIPGRPPSGEAPGTAGALVAVAIVVDTNIWLDMLVFDDSQTRRLGALLGAADVMPVASVPALAGAVAVASQLGGAASAVITPLATGEMRAELADVIGRAAFSLAPAAQAAVLARYDAIVTPSAAAPDCRLPCRDPDDRKFLDLAIGRRAHWLLSRDRALLASRKLAFRRFALRIGRVADFYDWLDGITAHAGRQA